MEQQTGSKLGKEYVKAVLSPCLFNLYAEYIMRNAGLEEPEIKLPTSAGSSKKQESSRKTSISALLTMPKPLTVWITITVENSERDGNTTPPDLPL